MKFWKKFGWFMLGLTPVIAVLVWQMLVSGVGMFIFAVIQGVQAAQSGEVPTYETLMEGFLTGTSYAMIMFAIYIGYLLIFGLWYWLMFCRKKQSGNWKQVMRLKRIGGIIGCGIALQFGISMALNLILPLFPDLMENYSSSVMEALGNESAFMILCVCLFAPIGEELIFRGLTMRIMEKAMPWQAALVVQAVLFGVYHLNLVQGVYAVVLGLIFGYFAHRYGSVVPGILLHMVINTSSYVIGYILPASLEEQIGAMVLIGVIGLAAAAGFGVLSLKGVHPVAQSKSEKM